MLLSFCCAKAESAVAEDVFDLSLEQLLNAEVVSVSKTKQTVEQSPAAVYVITAEDITRSGVTSIPDALRMAPGVDVAQQDNGTWDINIRGFNTGLANQLLVMVDGRTIYNPLFAGTYWELQNLPLEDIDRIEVIRGPGGTLWGANAMNGVINIITKKAQDTQGKLIRAAAGNSLQDSVLGQQGAKTADDAYYRVYAQHENDGPLHDPEGGEAFGSLRDSRTGFRYDHGDNLTVSGDAYVNTTDQLVSVPQFTAPWASVLNDEHDSQGANLLAHWKKNYDDGAQFSIQSYVDHTYRNQVVLSDEEDILDFDMQYNARQIGPHEIITGGGYRLTHSVAGNTSTLSIDPAVDNRSLFNSFVQDKIALVPDRWFLTLGSKVEHNEFTGFEIEPNARLQWFPDSQQTLWTAVSRAVSTPNPLESDLDSNAKVFAPNSLPAPFHVNAPIEYNLVANRDFESEQLVAYEAGYRNKLTPTVSVDIAAFDNFYTRVAGQQSAGPGTAGFGVVLSPVIYGQLKTELANLMSGQTYGAEMATDWNVNSNWKLSAGVTWLEMSLQPGIGDIGPQYSAGQSPNYQANLRSYWNINKDWSFDTSAYYVDRLVAYNDPAYIRVDANLGWKIEPGIQLNLVGQNLMQADHMEYGNTTDLNAAEIPRSYYAKITCKF